MPSKFAAGNYRGQLSLQNQDKLKVVSGTKRLYYVLNFKRKVFNEHVFFLDEHWIYCGRHVRVAF
ncbi:MAG TPA: hypothetical protein VIK59_07810 [Verrucomicrobiae bacterium]